MKRGLVVKHLKRGKRKMDKKFKIIDSVWVWVFTGTVLYFVLGFMFGFFKITLISIIGGAIWGLYLKLTGQI